MGRVPTLARRRGGRGSRRNSSPCPPVESVTLPGPGGGGGEGPLKNRGLFAHLRYAGAAFLLLLGALGAGLGLRRGRRPQQQPDRFPPESGPPDHS